MYIMGKIYTKLPSKSLSTFSESSSLSMQSSMSMSLKFHLFLYELEQGILTFEQLQAIA